ncbi:MAG: indolepyruvate ferredoxin oxidoreductase [Bacteroidales bacterium]|nr:indolepyruvate ferredoxin oxidoreductase [Bacteroidales bacterium]
MNSSLLLGDEAIAQAALDAGISGVYAYPGTPSTEITEYIQQSETARLRGVHSHWSTNEKTAMEAALGMAFAGKRALVCMKHVGVNVAADAFMNAAVTGVVGGLVFVAADDPSMHSSQNEQDSRFYGQFALIPIFEPSNQQEAYNMVFEAFDFSEALGTPVMLRITTRLAHSRAGVTRNAERAENSLRFSDNPSQFVLLPGNARKQYNALLAKQALFQDASVNGLVNCFVPGIDRSKGFLAAGIAYNYLMEHYPEGCPHPILKIGQYPLPLETVRTLAAACDELIVLEEGYPLIEEALTGLLDSRWVIRGRKDGLLPRTGELNPDIVANALGLPATTQVDVPEVVRMRPPSLCTGCGHRDVFEALQEVYQENASDCRIFGDIGCYTLGYLPPFRAMHTCVDMGASITMAKGAADAGLKYPVAVIGDSTFTHSGMTSLLDAINEQSSITVIISDNETTGMTGGQPSAGTGKLEAICLGLGVEPDHLHVLIPLKKNYDQMVELLRQELAYEGVSVIIPRRECIQTLSRKKRS